MPGNQSDDFYDFQTLQEEAVRRAREMQARAHLSPGIAPTSDEPAGVPREEPVPSAPLSAEPAPYDEASPEEPGFGFLDSLLKDNERTLIWVLILILLEEKADTALIFALMYLAN